MLKMQTHNILIEYKSFRYISYFKKSGKGEFEISKRIPNNNTFFIISHRLKYYFSTKLIYSKLNAYIQYKIIKLAKFILGIWIVFHQLQIRIHHLFNQLFERYLQIKTEIFNSVIMMNMSKPFYTIEKLDFYSENCSNLWYPSKCIFCLCTISK